MIRIRIKKNTNDYKLESGTLTRPKFQGFDSPNKNKNKYL
jgi:hypothetical protein